MVKLILIRGPPGSGKSSVSVALAEKLKKRTIVIPKDSIVFGFHFVHIEDDKLKSQGVINATSSYYLKKGVNVIVEGVFGGSNPKKKINVLKRLATKEGAQFILVSLDTEFGTSFKRNQQRPDAMSKKVCKKWYDHFYKVQVTEGLLVKNEGKSKAVTVKEIISYINST